MSGGLLSVADLKEIEERDRVFAAIGLSYDMMAEMASGRGLRALMEGLRTDAMEALRAFAEADATKLSEVIPLQVRVRAFMTCERLINQIIERGQHAEDFVRAAEGLENE